MHRSFCFSLSRREGERRHGIPVRAIPRGWRSAAAVRDYTDCFLSLLRTWSRTQRRSREGEEEGRGGEGRGGEGRSGLRWSG